MRRLTLLGTAAFLFAAATFWSACDEGTTPTAALPDAEARPEALRLPAPDPGARPNRTAHATSPAGHSFRMEYQPDWVSKITMTQGGPDGSRSSAVLFRNDGYKLRDPGAGGRDVGGRADRVHDRGPASTTTTTTAAAAGHTKNLTPSRVSPES